MRIKFSKYAKLELEDTVSFYELQQPGLGKRFKNEVKKATLRIAEYPTAWATKKGEIRKCLLHKFPYKLIYSIESDHIFIIAVAHQFRNEEIMNELERALKVINSIKEEQIELSHFSFDYKNKYLQLEHSDILRATCSSDLMIGLFDY